MPSPFSVCGPRIFRRASAAALLFLCLAGPLLYFFSPAGSPYQQPRPFGSADAGSGSATAPRVPPCDPHERSGAAEEWKASLAKYKDLPDDKFT